MIDLKMVASIYWNKHLGQKLRRLRGQQSVRAVAEKVTELGEKVSFQYIHMLEDPTRYPTAASSVSTEKLKVILEALGSNVESFLTNSAKIFLESIDSLETLD
ncbi:hypothetical protein WKK05_38105 (plasmid) [Nostoc sp. UHCC 0302]|uniref:hypothetical protein n=1 Tax=Nostoc sp. UHCC 0302 TaxID=3134896 RepID=UPI00311CC952